jgi:MSHA biogenesis protein MshJ
MSIELKMPAALALVAGRFDRLSLRERALVVGAVLVAVVIGWNATVMDRLVARERALTGEVTTLQAQLEATSHATANLIEANPTTQALKRLEERQAALDQINARLASESAGLIPASQMVQVIRDVLSRQRGLVLVSLQNLPMTSLAPVVGEQPQPASGQTSAARSTLVSTTEAAPEEAAATPTPETAPASTVTATATATTPAPPADTGPYLHPVELVVEGNYLDIVTYLHALEALPWHFYWRVLELETRTYPRNRVRIELSTVSLEKEWIGV